MASILPKPERTTERLRKRADFLRARAGDYAAGAFVRVQMVAKANNDGLSRIGFTVTKKNGNAVIRNRIKRRLREAANQLPQTVLPDGADCVIISKKAVLNAPFDALKADIAAVITKAQRNANRH